MAYRISFLRFFVIVFFFRGGGGISLVDYFFRFFTTWLPLMVKFYLFLFFDSEFMYK